MLLEASVIDEIVQKEVSLWKADRWRAVIKQAVDHEQGFEAGVIQIFNKQEKAFLSKFGTSKGIAADVDAAFDQKHWNLVLEEFGQLLLPGVITERARAELANIYVGTGFDVANPRVIAYLKNKTYKFAKEVNDTTLTKLKATLAEGTKEGQSVVKLRDRIRLVFTDATKRRATMIARTEVLGASNFGAYESYVQSEVVKEKEWLTTIDGRERPSHAAINGQIRKLKQTFSNGLMQPGDMAGSAAEVINCRCTLLPLVEEG